MSSRILPIFALVLAGAILFGYVSPTYQGDIAQAQAQIKSYQGALDASKKFSEKETELAAAQAAIPADQLSRLAAYLPDGVNNVQLILDLNALAARSGVTLSNFSVNQPTPSAQGTGLALNVTGGNNLDSLDISVGATGTYAQFRTFLRGIEQSLRPMDVMNVSVTGGGGGVYTYAITMRIYWLH